MKIKLLLILFSIMPMLASAQNAVFIRKKKTKTTTSATVAPKQKQTVPFAIPEAPLKSQSQPKPTSKAQPKPNQKPVAKPVAARIFYDASSNSLIFGDNYYQMIYVPGGSFMMGATSEQGPDAQSDEMPAHRVTLSSYYIGQTEVTQALWQAVMGSNPSRFKGYNRPVDQVSWNDCQVFINKLNSLTGLRFRLPTEAEWEFAARGGDKSQGYKFSGSNSIDDVTVYVANSANKGSSSPDFGTHEVATMDANELGIYDMSGNVWEWCSDWYGDYDSSLQIDPVGPNSGTYRVNRGGGWASKARACRISFRFSSVKSDRRGSDIGLRLALLP